MPQKFDPRFDRSEERLLDIQGENEELRAEVAELKRKLEIAVNTLREVRREEVEDVAGEKPESFVVLLAALIVARTLVFALIERMGSKARVEGMGFTAVFALTGLILFARWFGGEWRACRWLAVPKCAFVLLGLRFSIDVLNEGWRMDAVDAGHPFAAAGVAVGVLVLAALPAYRLAMEGLLAFCNDPVGTLKGAMRTLWEMSRKLTMRLR